MIELNDFYNDGHGWICRPCERELEPVPVTDHGTARFYREGEVEGGAPRLETRALAKWTDRTRRFLVCPRCGIVEAVDIS